MNQKNIEMIKQCKLEIAEVDDIIKTSSDPTELELAKEHKREWKNKLKYYQADPEEEKVNIFAEPYRESDEEVEYQILLDKRIALSSAIDDVDDDNEEEQERLNKELDKINNDIYFY